MICEWTHTSATLVRELDSMGVPHAVVVADREEAVDLYEDGYAVVHGDAERETCWSARTCSRRPPSSPTPPTSATRASSSRRNRPRPASGSSRPSNPRTADYHRYAGADRVVTPRHLLGESLASKAATAVQTDVGDAIEIVELMIQRDSPVVGDTVFESALADSGGTVIGAWFRGEFVSPPRPDDVIDEHTILLVAGREAQLEEMKELTLSETRGHRRGTVVIAGYGEVGTTVGDALAAADVPTTVVDERDKPGVDDARSVILALDSDTTSVFAALRVSQFAPEVEVIARANDPDSTTKLYRAGCEYVLALATVSGRILASSLLEDEEVTAPDTQIEVVRTAAPGLVGETLGGADVRARTNCTVIAAERDDDFVTDVGPEFRVQHGDTLIVAGLDADINRFNELAA